MFAQQVGKLKQAPEGRWRWYHGLAALAAANLLAFTMEGMVAWAAGNADGFALFSDAQRDYYYDLKQASFAPPGWVFGPAWIINNIFALAGLGKVLNKPAATPGRSPYVKLQAASWLIFVAFNASYVGLRSPINAFALTFGMWLLTIASIIVAWRTLRDRQVAWSLGTLTAWLTLASAVALCQALWNPDALYGVGPFSEPPAWLLRS